jgi:flagellar basal-body rod protein FlgF
MDRGLYIAASGMLAEQIRHDQIADDRADTARSMVDMIASLRAFEAGQRVIHTIDGTLAESTTHVDSLNGT